MFLWLLRFSTICCRSFCERHGYSWDLKTTEEILTEFLTRPASPHLSVEGYWKAKVLSIAQFATFALAVDGLMVTEAAVERSFSLMKRVRNPLRSRLSRDALQAQMVIAMNFELLRKPEAANQRSRMSEARVSRRCELVDPSALPNFLQIPLVGCGSVPSASVQFASVTGVLVRGVGVRGSVVLGSSVHFVCHGGIVRGVFVPGVVSGVCVSAFKPSGGVPSAQAARSHPNEIVRLTSRRSPSEEAQKLVALPFFASASCIHLHHFAAFNPPLPHNPVVAVPEQPLGLIVRVLELVALPFSVSASCIPLPLILRCIITPWLPFPKSPLVLSADFACFSLLILLWSHCVADSGAPGRLACCWKGMFLVLGVILSLFSEVFPAQACEALRSNFGN